MYVCVFMYLIVLIMIIVIVLYICRNLIARDLGSPLIDGIFLVQKICIYSCVTLSVYNFIDYARSSSMRGQLVMHECLHHVYIFSLRLASKCLNCTRSPEEIVQKLHKYD